MSDSAQIHPVTARQQEMVERAIAQTRSEIEGRVAVVTGGARGIGQSIADALLKAGAKVVAADKTWENSSTFKKHLESSGNAMAVTMDVTDNTSLDAAYAAVIERFGTTDVLINNAALVSETLFQPLGHVNTLDTKDSDWKAMFDVNLFGAVKAIRRFIRPMQEKGSGSIINVVSSGVMPVSTGGGYFGLRPWTVEMPYQATKAALMALTFYLGEEVRKDGVAVNAMMPGHTRASWFDNTARAFQNMGSVYFMRPAIPEHVLPLTLFLSGQDGHRVTGRLYYIPDWNYDHGFGDYAAWLDHDLPEDMEATYVRLENAVPKYSRSGVPHLPFDAQSALWVSAMGALAAEKDSGSNG